MQLDAAKIRFPKKFWKYVNSKTNYRTGVGDLSYTDDNDDIKIATDDQTKADALVKFFSNVFTARCTIVHSAVLRLHGVRPSVRPSVRLSVRL